MSLLVGIGKTDPGRRYVYFNEYDKCYRNMRRARVPGRNESFARAADVRDLAGRYRNVRVAITPEWEQQFTLPDGAIRRTRLVYSIVTADRTKFVFAIRRRVKKLTAV